VQGFTLFSNLTSYCTGGKEAGRTSSPSSGVGYVTPFTPPPHPHAPTPPPRINCSTLQGQPDSSISFTAGLAVSPAPYLVDVVHGLNQTWGNSLMSNIHLSTYGIATRRKIYESAFVTLQSYRRARVTSSRSEPKISNRTSLGMTLSPRPRTVEILGSWVAARMVGRGRCGRSISACCAIDRFWLVETVCGSGATNGYGSSVQRKDPWLAWLAWLTWLDHGPCR
jgi:hypothetical protein